MGTTRGILFLVVTLIIIVSIYYIVKMVKGRTQSRSTPSPSTSPSPSDQTDEISISDLKFERTLNPDKSNSKGDDGIAGYTIEYDPGIDYDVLSKNVTFTLSWENNIGFTGNVKGFNIEHYVSGEDGTYLDSANKSINFETKKTSDTDTTENAVSLDNFGENSVSIVSDGTYSVVGNNRFKISVIMNNNTNKLLYNGLEQTEDGHEIGIGGQDLGATLNMTVPQTVTYTPVTQSFASAFVDIKKTTYQIYNPVRSLSSFDTTLILLMPAFPKNVMGEKVVDVDTFFFKYRDGDYLLEDLKKGAWNEKTSRERNVDFDNTKHDNRMFVSFYDKSKDTNDKVTAQLRYTKMGYGTGTAAITTDENGKLELMDISDTDTVSETQFNNSVWTFIEDGDIKCDGSDGISIKRGNYSAVCNNECYFCRVATWDPYFSAVQCLHYYAYDDINVIKFYLTKKDDNKYIFKTYNGNDVTYLYLTSKKNIIGATHYDFDKSINTEETLTMEDFEKLLNAGYEFYCYGTQKKIDIKQYMLDL
jgi:hypothetical protein